MAQDGRLLRLAECDNVYVATTHLHAGDEVAVGETAVRVDDDVELGHKVAAATIELGQPVVRGGMAIGLATRRIEVGDWVHTHNLVSSYIRTFDHRGGADVHDHGLRQE
ncbi:MAG TPA: UxaA family hydrolase [Lapillicoccus sp.]|uniref:UxaA family hydrolase n=1 Tax=Lapillicoccus sp. TaxID=1909287 RepID=UPI002F947CCC